MKSKAVKLVFILLVILIFSNSCTHIKTRRHEKIRASLNTIKIINTHEHQRQPFDFSADKRNLFCQLYESPYLKADMVSAGGPQLSFDTIENQNLDDLWELYGQALNFSRNTTFYRQFLYGFQYLYDFEDPYFTKNNIHDLSLNIALNYRDYDAWFDKAFKKANYSVMFNDQYWDTFNTNIDGRYFALVFNVNGLVLSICKRPGNNIKAQDDYLSFGAAEFYKIAENKNYDIQSLDDYLEFANIIFQQFVDSNAVCIKNSLAYIRSIDFEDVPYEEAKRLYARESTSLSKDERKRLQDFMFHWIIKKSIEFDLPIQIHTGYLSGNRSYLGNGRPMKLNNLFVRYPSAKFILFHGGYPWTGEYIAFGKTFPNVFIDLVWLPQISRSVAIQSIHHLLDCVPYNKIFWGGDCSLIEESIGSLQIAKEVISQVLAERVDNGLMSEEAAFDVGLRIFRENAIDVFNLNEKLKKQLQRSLAAP